MYISKLCQVEGNKLIGCSAWGVEMVYFVGIFLGFLATYIIMRYIYERRYNTEDKEVQLREQSKRT